MEETASPELGIKIKMLFFGPLAENMGQREIEVALVMGSTARDLIQRFRLTHLLDTGLRIAINGEIGADIELRQCAVEQAWHMAADRMGIIDHDPVMPGAQPVDLSL